jgi:AraC-like DNA-binding protein/ligand-binding sensor protein
MLRYAIDLEELNRVLGLFSRLFDVRTTFFDAAANELGDLRVKAMSGFCRRQRRDAAFNRRCIECDRRHLERARQTGRELVYRCHSGLIEAVVPLHDEHGGYLGALVLGQLRPRGASGRGLPAAARRLYLRLPQATARRAGEMARLLRYVSEHIIRYQLVRRDGPRWAQRLDRYIDDHLGERLRLADLTRAIRVSPSFLSHRCRAELGLPPLKYVAEKRLQVALERLVAGARVYEVASELGFYDEFHFSRRFKARFGHSPRRYLAARPGVRSGR